MRPYLGQFVPYEVFLTEMVHGSRKTQLLLTAVTTHSRPYCAWVGLWYLSPEGEVRDVHVLTSSSKIL